MPKCEIKWIDEQTHRMTADTNEAVQMVRRKEYYETIFGETRKYTNSPWFYICAEHSKRLSEPSMCHWECKPLPMEGET